LYVLNAASTSNFKGFRVDRITGRLTSLAGGQCNLLPPLNSWPFVPDTNKTETFAMPGQIGFAPDGKKLVITRKEGPLGAQLFTGPFQGVGRIDIYALDDNGKPVNCNAPAVNINNRADSLVVQDPPQKGRFPFAFTFSANAHLLVTEVVGVVVVGEIPNGSPFKSSAMSSYQIKSNGKLQLKTGSVANGETAMCWVVRSGKFVYGANAASNSISKYEIQENGALKLLNATEAVVGPESSPIDMAIAANGGYLYQLAPGKHGTVPGTGKIHAYKIDKTNGNLMPIGTVDIPGAALSGQAGMAVVEF
jgi:hypothetical protein